MNFSGDTAIVTWGLDKGMSQLPEKAGFPTAGLFLDWLMLGFCRDKARLGCSIGFQLSCGNTSCRFWLGEVVRVGVDFLELKIENSLDFERVRSILVPDWCFTQASLFFFPSLVDLTLFYPVALVPTSIFSPHWILGSSWHFILLFCCHQIFSGPGGVIQRVLPILPSILLPLLSSSLHEFPCSEPFPTSSMGEVTWLSEEDLSFPSLDLGEERVIDDSCESSKIELRVWEWGKEERRDKGVKWARIIST